MYVFVCGGKTLQIVAYCLDWHTTISNAFHDLVIEPLKSYADIKLVGWDGTHLPVEDNDYPPDLPRIFCMFPPPPEWPAKTQARVVWIPMSDFANHPPSGWDSLPTHTRIVLFSKAGEAEAKHSGFRTVSLQYFKNPADFPPASWDNRRVLLYWNRTGLVGPRFLEKLCAALDVDTLLFRSKIDPQINPKAQYSLPRKLGHTIVQEYSELTSSREEYLALLRQANIYLAPRRTEGVGMVNLEAMASGCAVLASRAPTMSEYITSGKNGYLVDAVSSPALQRVIGLMDRVVTNGRLVRIRKYLPRPSTSRLHPITPFQNWKEIARLDLKAIGDRARADHQAGYEAWRSSIETYAHFILDW